MPLPNVSPSRPGRAQTGRAPDIRPVAANPNLLNLGRRGGLLARVNAVSSSAVTVAMTAAAPLSGVGDGQMRMLRELGQSCSRCRLDHRPPLPVRGHDNSHLGYQMCAHEIPVSPQWLSTDIRMPAARREPCPMSVDGT